MVFDSRSRPARAAGTRLVFTDEGSHVEHASGGEPLPVSELGSIIWRALDGTTTIGAIASDVAEARSSTIAEETTRIIEFLGVLDDRGLLDGPTDAFDGPTTSAGATTSPEPLPPSGQGFDYIMEPYPITAATGPRLRSVDLLLALLPLDGPERDGWPSVIDAVVEAIGPNRTVWGAKRTAEGTFTWELYFYPHRRPGGESIAEYFASVHDCFAQLGGWRAPTSVPENTTLFSFELAFTDTGMTEPPIHLDIYERTTESPLTVVAYDRTVDHFRFKNLYHFFTFDDQLSQLQACLDSSRYARPGNEERISDFWLTRIRALSECWTVCSSFKPDADGVYFSRIGYPDMQRFLIQASYPTDFVRWFSENQDGLGHLRHDVAFDYVVDDDGTVDILRTAFYGWF